MELDRRIKRFVTRLRFWIFGKQLVHALFWCVPAGVFVGAVFEAVSYFVPWYSVHYWAAGAVLLSVLAALIWCVLHFPSAHHAALLLDETGLCERTVTALELAGNESFFAVLQKNDAWELLSRVAVRKRLPVALTWKRPVLLVTLCILFSVSCLLPSSVKIEAKNLHQVVEQAKDEIEKVEKVQDELEKEELTSKELEEYDSLMDDIRKELKEADSQEALEKALERAEKKLNQVAEKTEDQSLKDKLQQLSLALNKDGSGEKDGDQKDSSQAQASADLEKAKNMKESAEEAEELLEKLQEAGDLSELSEEELEAMKEALENLAELAEDQELASSLQNAAAQIGSGSLSSSALASAQASVSAMKQTAGTMLASGTGQPHFSKNGQSGSGTGNSSGSGSSGNGSGSGSGSGSGNSSGSGESGSGSGSGGSGSGGSGSGNGTGWNYGSKNGKEKDISYNGELVSVPNGVGDDENLTGRNNEGTSYVTEGGDSLTWSGNSVEYGQVISEYSKQALSDIQSSDYPAGVQDIVKSYFEELNQ